jgi:hypothetical protein
MDIYLNKQLLPLITMGYTMDALSRYENPPITCKLSLC